MKTLIDLKAKAYLYYPKDISSFKDKVNYGNSSENKRLNDTLKNINYNELKKVDKLKNKLNVVYNKIIYDFTILSWQDRAHNIQFILNKRENKTYILCINISILIPVYTCYIIEIEFDLVKNKLKHSPKRNLKLEKTIFKKYIEETKLLIENITNYEEISCEFSDSKIADLSFQDIELGKFTIFNAFFLNNIYTQIF